MEADNWFLINSLSNNVIVVEITLNEIRKNMKNRYQTLQDPFQRPLNPINVLLTPLNGFWPLRISHRSFPLKTTKNAKNL